MKGKGKQNGHDGNLVDHDSGSRDDLLVHMDEGLEEVKGK